MMVPSPRPSTRLPQDDAHAIVENIYRRMTNGEPAMKATQLAVGE